jgi:hypothetical protein
MILLGSPIRLYRLSISNCAVSSEVSVLLQGIKITPFERPWSTTTKIESCPSAEGRSVIKSMEQLAKGQVDVAPSIGMYIGLEGIRSILNC